MTDKLAFAHSGRWALLGASGVTGRMVLAEAVSRGHRPVLIGRNPDALARLAEPHGLEVRAASLDDGVALRSALAGTQLLVNVAGPFSLTSAPAIDAALAARTDYIDLNGELSVLRDLLERDEPAKSSGRVLVGGAGFGVAATDGLALQVSNALGGAEELRLSVAADSAFSSPAVAESTLGVLAGGGFEIENGALLRRTLARARWSERLPNGKTVPFASAPLAELIGARHATDARRVVAGVPMPSFQGRVLSIIAPLLPLLMKVPFVRRRMVSASGHAAVDPGAGSHRSRIWVRGKRGARTAGLMLEGGESYALAATLAVLAIETLFSRRPVPGAYTPATAFGAEFIGRVDGVSIREI